MKGLREGVNGVNTEFQTTKNPPRRVFLILAELSAIGVSHQQHAQT